MGESGKSGSRRRRRVYGRGLRDREVELPEDEPPFGVSRRRDAAAATSRPDTLETAGEEPADEEVVT